MPNTTDTDDLFKTAPATPAKAKKERKPKKAKDDTPPPVPWTLEDARQRNRESMRCCWPDWEGPRVEDSIHGRCQVGQTCAYNLARGCTTYLYCVPLRIISVTADGNTIVGAIDYDETVHPGLADQNGELVLLDIWEVWPPVDLLWQLRHEQERLEKLESEGVTA